MAAGLGSEGPEDTSAPRLSLRQRLLLSLPRVKQDRAKPHLGDRLRDAFLKPAPEASASSAKDTKAASGASVEDLDYDARYANDKERLIGLMAAPLAAAIGILVISALISNDPPAFLKNGQPNKLHVNVSTYHELIYVLLGLSILILATAWFRKRLFLGMAMALYGLAIFNLHYWGFGVPFIMVAAWLLVRTYRLQKELREATASGGGRTGPLPQLGPRSNKRYTPRASSSRRPASSKAKNQRRAV